MDIDLLRTFVEVSSTRHFGKAAQNLFVTQSAVSARIRLLERTLGAGRGKAAPVIEATWTPPDVKQQLRLRDR